MKKNSPLYDALKQWMGQSCDWSHLSHLKTCLWMIMALCQTGSVSLTKWTVYMPCRGQFAQSKQRRISRWLHNARINVHRLYAPLVQASLAHWNEAEMYLALDTSLFWEEYCVVRLCVVHRGRALPIVWRVFKHKSASLAFPYYREMLQQGAKRLPKDIKIVLLADRGFVHTGLMRMATNELGWHYRIRVKSNSWIYRTGKGWFQLKDLHCQQGQPFCFQSVRLHKTESYGMVSVIIGLNNLNGEFWAIVSDEHTTLQCFREYGLRFDIEENFLDDQSSGWNLQRSELRDVPALSRLCFLLAVATLYVTAQGVELVESGKRRWIDTHWFRGNSYFRLGWDWIKAASLHGWSLIHQVYFTSNHDPDPAIPSRTQHHSRLYRFEFTVQTYYPIPA